MSNGIKVSQLPNTEEIKEGDIFLLVQDGETKKALLSVLMQSVEIQRITDEEIDSIFNE